MQIFFEQEGDLNRTSLPKILKHLCNRSETGMLSLEKGEIKKSIFLNSGDIVFAASNREDDRLGNYLFRNGALSYEDFERSSELMTPNRRHGEILVELGIITRRSLNWAVKEQVKEIIMSLFQWEHGHFSFISMGPLENESITLKTKTLDLIFEGTRRMGNWSVIQHEIGSLDTVFQHSEKTTVLRESLYMKPKEKKVLDVLQESQSLRSLCNSLTIKDFELCRILMGLLSAGMIEKVGRAVESC
jgi:hypothetical protein